MRGRISDFGGFVRGTVLLACLVALLALPASAAASTRSAMTTVPGHANGTATAKCPSGQRATGGGFQAPAQSLAGGLTVFESRKVGQRSWQASGLEDNPAPATLTAFVYCSKSAPKTKEKSVTVPVPVGPTFPSAQAGCGHAGKAQAGGFLAPLDPTLTNYAYIVDSFRASGESWQSRARNGSGAPTLTTYVYCADQGAPKARPGSVTSSTPGLAPTTAASGNCKRGTHVLAGGFSQPDARLGNYAFPWESLRVGRRWQASALHSTTVSTTLTSIAYCG